jgi:hypothetical protein
MIVCFEMEKSKCGKNGDGSILPPLINSIPTIRHYTRPTHQIKIDKVRERERMIESFLEDLSLNL